MITRQIQRRNGETFTVLLDDCDAELFDSQPWHISRCGTARKKKTLYYVERNGAQCNYERAPKVKLHRVIAGAKEGEQVDHIDQNTLNNCRSNLRICTPAQNQCNVGKRGNNPSGFVGVYRNSHDSPAWQAKVKNKGRTHYVGAGNDPVELAVKRDLLALKLHGEFAVLNFPALRAEAVEDLVLSA